MLLIAGCPAGDARKREEAEKRGKEAAMFQGRRLVSSPDSLLRERLKGWTTRKSSINLTTSAARLMSGPEVRPDQRLSTESKPLNKRISGSSCHSCKHICNRRSIDCLQKAKPVVWRGVLEAGLVCHLPVDSMCRLILKRTGAPATISCNSIVLILCTQTFVIPLLRLAYLPFPAYLFDCHFVACFPAIDELICIRDTASGARSRV